MTLPYVCHACNGARGFVLQEDFVPCGLCTTRMGLPKPHTHVRMRSKSRSTVNTDDSVTVLEVCRCGAHRSVIVANGRAERTEWK